MSKIIVISGGLLRHFGHDGSLLAVVEEAHWAEYAAQVPEAAEFFPKPDPVEPPPVDPSPLIFLQEPDNGQETPPAPQQ